MPGGIETMHIHPPKPLHGWKEFLNEIFVIVIGVLIALGFEQVVEELHWQHKVHEGEERLKEELNDAYAISAERIAFSPCFAAQIDRLAARIRDGGPEFDGAPVSRSPRTPEVARVLFHPERPISTQTWQSLQQDGTIAHFSVRRQWILGRTYTQLELFRQRFDQIAELRGELDALGGRLTLTPDAKLQLLEKLSSMQSLSARTTLTAKQIIIVANGNGLAPSAAAADSLVNQSLKLGGLQICRDQGLPIANWREAVEREERAAPEFYRDLRDKL